MNFKTLILLAVSFLEGGMLMSYELLSSKMYTPIIGSSIYVWTSILSMVLLGLAIGYRLGDKVTLENAKKTLIGALIFTGGYILITPFLSSTILPSLMGADIRIASLIAGMLIVLIPMIALGLVSPIIIKLLSTDQSKVGVNAGSVYFISTIGGVVLAMLFVFKGIELVGVHFLILTITAILIGSGLIVKLFVR